MALSDIGVAPIADLEAADSVPAQQAKIQWPRALAEVGRSATWNCLKKPAVLAATAQNPIIPVPPVPAATAWAPATNYVVGDYVTFGSPAYLYQALIANLSTASFVNDLTQGFWMQTDLYNADPFNPCCAGSNYPSGWAYKYPLPADCLLVTHLNDTPCEDIRETYEIMGTDLYTNESQAVIKYTWADPDTTNYDGLLVNALVKRLASFLATKLRQDDTDIAVTQEKLYDRALSKARVKNAGERAPRPWSPVANSRWVGSRYRSTNS